MLLVGDSKTVYVFNDHGDVAGLPSCCFQLHYLAMMLNEVTYYLKSITGKFET